MKYESCNLCSILSKDKMSEKELKTTNMVDNFCKVLLIEGSADYRHIEKLLKLVEKYGKPTDIYSIYKLWYLRGLYDQLDSIIEKVGKMSNKDLIHFYKLIFKHSDSKNFQLPSIFRVGRPTNCLSIGTPLFNGSKKGAVIDNWLNDWLKTFPPTLEEFNIIVEEAARLTKDGKEIYYKFSECELNILMLCSKYIQEPTKPIETPKPVANIEEKSKEESKEESKEKSRISIVEACCNNHFAWSNVKACGNNHFSWSNVELIRAKKVYMDLTDKNTISFMKSLDPTVTTIYFKAFLRYYPEGLISEKK